MKRFLIPLAVFLVLVVFLAVGLKRDPREVPSPLVGKPAPEFRLDTLTPGKQFSPADMRGKVWLLNVWGSWCAACQVEHPLLLDLAKAGTLPIVGLAWKDMPNNSKAWLQRLGDPYSVVISDFAGKAAIDLGVYGAPETFLIDREGIVRFKHVGPITPQVLDGKLMPLVRSLARG